MDRLSRDGLTGRRAKAFGGVVEVRSGKARIVVESCRGRFVAERMRHSADRGARLDGRRCGGVTKIVRSDVQAQAVDSRIEDVAAEIAVPMWRGVHRKMTSDGDPLSQDAR
jgi:hypothetical protein